VVVLDIAFAGVSGGGVSFATVTAPFIAALGPRLAAWVDHHDHEKHIDFAGDSRFVLRTKQQAGGCPEIITSDMVRMAGPVDTILAHVDLDGLYSAAKWILEGREPYPGADSDARAIDTRTGSPSEVALKIDRALRARFRDDDLKRSIVHWLVGGMRAGPHRDVIDEAAAQFAERDRGTEALSRRFVRRGRINYVDASANQLPYDKTDLLLRGQEQCAVSAVRDSGSVTIAARFDSGWDFVTLLGLGGGMPTRVTIPEGRADEAMELINSAIEPEGSS
jgi:hypothetical protein